jgi:hypothetical protein
LLNVAGDQAWRNFGGCIVHWRTDVTSLWSHRDNQQTNQLARCNCVRSGLWSSGLTPCILVDWYEQFGETCRSHIRPTTSVFLRSVGGGWLVGYLTMLSI